MTKPAAISYEQAFFANETTDPTEFDGLFEKEAACFHEAGHAVVGHRLGFGVSAVSASITCEPIEGSGKLGYRFGGLYTAAKLATTRMAREIRREGYGPAAIANAVMTCAGPAAELRFRQESGLPLRLLGATLGDHEAVDRIGKYLDCQHGRNSFAFRRLAWRKTWALVHQADVWASIADLAEVLELGLNWPEDVGTETYALPGATVRAIMRRALADASE